MFSMWSGIIALTAFGFISGGILGYAARRFRVDSDPVVENIDAILPQSQCAQCGYPGCRPYAEAVANGDNINKCVPGGEAVMLKIADLMGVEPQSMDEVQAAIDPIRKIAFIDESNCIGCTKCIQACPVDAILGSNKSVHTVLVDLCTGCDLCIAPCPTDCIEMRPLPTTIANWKWQLQTIPVHVIEERLEGSADA